MSLSIAVKTIQGVTGPGGINAYSTIIGFSQPQIGTTVNVQIPSGNWLQVGQYVFIPSGGYYSVASGSTPTFSLQNLGYSNINIPVGSTVATSNIAPAGVAGGTGATGIQGVTGPQGNAFSTTAGFTQPLVGTTVKINSPTSLWQQIGQYVFIPSGGYYQIASGANPTFSIINLGYSGVNIPVGSTISTGFMSPGGVAGVTGATGVTGPAGINAYSTSAGFSQPPVGTTIPVQISSGYWLQVGQGVFIASGGAYQVASGSVPTFSLINLGYAGNLPVGSNVSTGTASPNSLIAGVTGATGPGGSQGASAMWVYNNGATLGQFIIMNFGPGLQGVTGPNAFETTITTLPDIAVLGVTGSNGVAGFASGAMMYWNNQFITPTGAIGATTIGTAAGWVTIQKSAYYRVNYTLAFTGIPSGVHAIQAVQYVSATGGSSQYGFGSGSAIAQSYGTAYFGATGAGASGLYSNIHKNYLVYLPSGTSIETYVNYYGGGASGIVFSPTGTVFNLETIG